MTFSIALSIPIYPRCCCFQPYIFLAACGFPVKSSPSAQTRLTHSLSRQGSQEYPSRVQISAAVSIPTMSGVEDEESSTMGHTTSALKGPWGTVAGKCCQCHQAKRPVQLQESRHHNVCAPAAGLPEAQPLQGADVLSHSGKPIANQVPGLEPIWGMPHSSWACSCLGNASFLFRFLSF